MSLSVDNDFLLDDTMVSAKDFFPEIFDPTQSRSVSDLMKIHNVWTKNLTISTNTNTKADCKKVEDKTYVLLFDGINSELINTTYDSTNNSYKLLDKSNPSTKLSFNTSTETASIDVDSNNTMWLAYEENTIIKVNSSIFPYNKWGTPTPIATGVKPDDICVIKAFPDKIGVLWSNQNTQFFGFKTHLNVHQVIR